MRNVHPIRLEAMFPRFRNVLAVAILALTGAAACGEADRSGTDTDQLPRSEPSPPSAEAADRSADHTCLNPSGPQLTGETAGSVRIGMTETNLREECTVVADTTLSLEGQAQPALLVEVGRDTVLAEIADAKVWRIRVRSAGLRTGDSVGVGTPARQLLSAPGASVAWGEGNHVLLTPEHCGLSFLLAGLPRRARPWTAPEIADMPDTVRVDQVLVIGSCDGPGGARR